MEAEITRWSEAGALAGSSSISDHEYMRGGRGGGSSSRGKVLGDSECVINRCQLATAEILNNSTAGIVLALYPGSRWAANQEPGYEASTVLNPTALYAKKSI